MVTLGELVDLVDGLVPTRDRRRLGCRRAGGGDPDAEVRRVLLAVDPVLPVAREAAAWDADLLVTHHPLFLRGVHGVAETDAQGPHPARR